MTAPGRSTQSLIDELVRATGAASPEEAIRIKARELIATHVDVFGEPSMPMNMDVLASLRSISRSDEKPLFSPDAELSPDGGLSSHARLGYVGELTLLYYLFAFLIFPPNDYRLYVLCMNGQ